VQVVELLKVVDGGAGVDAVAEGVGDLAPVHRPEAAVLACDGVDEMGWRDW
jgi:hypothetical protein